VTAIDKTSPLFRQWLEEEIASHGSQGKFADRLQLTHQTVAKWRAGGGVGNAGVSAIATYRNESEERVRRWIRGLDNQALEQQESKDLLQLMRTVPLSSVLAAMSVGLERLQNRFGLDSEAEPLSADLVVRWIKQTILKHCDRDTFASTINIDPQRLNAILDGQATPTKGEFEQLAQGLNTIRLDWDGESLEQVWTQPSTRSP